MYKWIDRFDEEGPEGLHDRKRDGRPRELGKEAREEIDRLLERNPTEEGQNATRWTAPRIAEHLDRELDIDVHENGFTPLPSAESVCLTGAQQGVGPVKERGHIGVWADLERHRFDFELSFQVDKVDSLPATMKLTLVVGLENH